jgi:hypothetical protein
MVALRGRTGHHERRGMLDLYEEFAALIDALEAASAEYALCGGGLAMAIHGFK